MTRRLLAEFLGTFLLVLGGCGTAVLAGGEVGFLGVALAFGLTVLCGAYAFGHISGGHFNPAVTLGLLAAGKVDARDVAPYIGVQVLGGLAACGVLAVVATGVDGFSIAGSGFAANGYGELSPGGYSLLAGLVTEIVLTAVFLFVILGSVRPSLPDGFAPVAIGLSLTLIHLVSIPVTNTSVNPARSLAPALFAGGDYLGQVWLFLVAPPIGAVIAGLLHRSLLDEPPGDDIPVAAAPVQEGH